MNNARTLGAVAPRYLFRDSGITNRATVAKHKLGATERITMAAATSDSTSSSLIARVRNADPQAWERLAAMYVPLVYQWGREAGLAEPDVADVAQNVFVAVHRGIGAFRGDRSGESFRGWLWRITRNEVLMLYRRKANQPQAVGGTDAQQAWQAVPDYFQSETAPSDERSEHELLRRAVEFIRNEFEPSTWQAFWQSTIDRRPGAEVAETLGLTPGAVRQAKYRVLKRLREFMRED